MKKTVIITVIALGISFTSLKASTSNVDSNVLEFVNPDPAISPFCMSIVKGDLVTVKKLIGLGADINAKSGGLTPAMYAAKFNKVEILKLLVANGANLKARSEKGYKAIKYAELSNAKEALAYLEGLES